MLDGRSSSRSRADGLCQLLREFRPDRGSAVRLDRGAARLLHSGDPALHHPDRVQADDAGRLRADSVRAVRQDRLCRRARARQRDFVRRQGSGAGRHRRHRLDAVCAVHGGFRWQSADHRSTPWRWCSERFPFLASVSSDPALPTASCRADRSSAREPRSAPASPRAAPSSLAPVSRPVVSDSPVARLSGGARGAATVASGTASAYRAGGLGGVASAGGSAIVSPLRRMAARVRQAVRRRRNAPPAWARRMKRAQTVNQGVSAATHAVRSGDGAGGGSSVDLSEGGH